MSKPRLVLVTAALAGSLAACAREPLPPSHLGAPTLLLSAEGSSPGEATERVTSGRNLASKVLAAMALERVTGRKPDPIHFAERP
jgi:hypothetical protein